MEAGMSVYNRKVGFVPIKLKAEWLGTPKGTVLALNERAANTLIERGSATLVAEPERVSAPTVVVEKDVEKPQKDKMMRPRRRKR